MIIDQVSSNMKSKAITLFNPKSHSITPYISNEFELERVQESVDGRYLEFIFVNKPLLPLYECLQSLLNILQDS